MNLPLYNLSKINNLKPQKGNLILAEPFMNDDYFSRSVIFMCEHNDDRVCCKNKIYVPQAVRALLPRTHLV